jgi:hypothetical protein
MAEGQQFLEHHSDLHAVRRSQRVELEGMAAGRPILVVRWPGDRAVDVCELAAVELWTAVDQRIAPGRALVA